MRDRERVNERFYDVRRIVVGDGQHTRDLLAKAVRNREWFWFQLRRILCSPEF